MPNPHLQKNAILEALLGSMGGDLGLDPQALARKKQRDYVQEQKQQARSDASGMNVGTKIMKSIGGTYQGPVGMAAPWLSSDGSTPMDPVYSLDGPYGQAGQEGVIQSQQMRGESPSRFGIQTQNAGGFVPSYAAFKGSVTPQGLSPQGLGAGALTGALMALTAGLAAGPGSYIGGQAGSQVGGRVAPHYSDSPYAGLVGSSIGGGLGGAVGGAIAPGNLAKSNPLGVVGEALMLPNNLIPDVPGTNIGSMFLNNTKANLPNVGTSGRDVLAGLNMKHQMKIQADMQKAKAPAPKPTALFGMPGIPTLGSII